MIHSKSRSIAVALAAMAAATSANATTLTLNATADHSGLVEDNSNTVGQYGRVDTLWGNSSSTNRQRNGLVQFEQLSPELRAGMIGGTITLDSVQLELWNSAATWTAPSGYGLNFMRLDDGNADWATLNGADTGGNGVSSWSDKVESSGLDWVATTGGGNRGQVFGSIEVSSSSTTVGENHYLVTFTGSELMDWLTSDIAPNLLVEQNASMNAVQYRFATINTPVAEGSPSFAPNLIINYTIPEPSAALLGAFGVLGLIRRRR